MAALIIQTYTHMHACMQAILLVYYKFVALLLLPLIETRLLLEETYVVKNLCSYLLVLCLLQDCPGLIPRICEVSLGHGVAMAMPSVSIYTLCHMIRERE